MKGTKGREEARPKGFEDPSIAFFDGFSSPILNQTDRDILLTIEGNPMTILQVSERMDMTFVEGLARTRRLWRMGLLERTGADDEEIGLYRYSMKRGY